MNYRTKIANPIFIVEQDEKIVIDDLQPINNNEYIFCVKNFDEFNINQINMYYQFKIIGINKDIDYSFKDLDKDQIIEFSDYLSPKFKLGLKKEEHWYSFCINLDESEITENGKINLEINTFYN